MSTHPTALQSLLDDPSVENVLITGADSVWLEKTDGSLVRAEPAADSNQELLAHLRTLVAQGSGRN